MMATKKKHRILMYVIGMIMLVLAFIDCLTAAINEPYILEALESNPLYRVTGSLALIFALNVVMIICFMIIYVKGTPFARFTCISFFVWHSIIRVYAIKSNLNAYYHPPSPEALALVTESFKTVSYAYVMLAIFIPFIVCVIIYALFSIDHKITRRDVTP